MNKKIFLQKGWSPEKSEAFKTAFYEFLKHCRVNSKELGNIALGDHLYRAQYRFFDAVFDGLGRDIHDVKHLKSRQLGVSTASRALTIFWAGVHPGLRGYMIFDSSAHQQEARLELINMIKSLPPRLKFPTIKRENRDLIELSNETVVNFASAGLKAGKTSGVLGRSSGVNFAHCSEICSWDNEEGVEAFKNSLAEDFPDRLYIWESTGRGPNMWKTIWEEALADPDHQICIFSGWWSKDNQSIPKGTADFARYGEPPPSDIELVKIREVKRLYDWQVTAEQLAWVRRKMDPAAKPEGDAPPEFEGDALRVQEQPWTAEESFQITGSIFFQPEVLTDQTNKHASEKFKSYSYTHGTEIIYCHVYPARNARSVELKVWEEPEPYDAVYIISADPAYGHNENNDRSAIQVLRCYADGLDQVAEYAWPLVNARQFAWVIASIAAWYAGDRNEVYHIIELNGPGDAVWAEWMSLKHNLQSGYLMREGDETGLRRVLPNIRNYVYQRNDSMSPGHNWQWQCLSINEAIPTPNGWTTMGDVKVGDWLFDETGNHCKVTLATEVMEGRDCFSITFDDKSSIVADDSHLWRLSDGRLVTTIGLKHGDTIDVTAPLDLPYADLPIDPYVLGVWLGDGFYESSGFCQHVDDMDEVSRHLLNCGMTLGPIRKDQKSKSRTRSILGLETALRKNGLLGNKHIPPGYLRASYEQRLALIQGLMDTDGTIFNRQCSLTTGNDKIASGFSELLRSIGIKAKYTIRHRTIMYKGEPVKCPKLYQFYFVSYPDMPVFRLKRKLDKQAHDGEVHLKTTKRHRIVDIERIASVPVRCIEVDSPSHLYLAGEGMIPTHNTTPRLKVSIMERLRDFVSHDMLHVRSAETIEEMKWVTREGDSIEAQGRKKDDRVVTLAMGIRCWEQRVRKTMMSQQRTRTYEQAKRRLTIRDQYALYSKYQLDQVFARKRRHRAATARVLTRAMWRG